ncbi:MAG TPA: hypothetical protein VFT50_10930 [Baekduia sp.]|nr:hypothetical protein [Baekduia sp.]
MRVGRDDLESFKRSVGPAPPPVEPLLSPADEVRVIVDARTDDAGADARRARVRALLRRPAPPTGADAEIVVLLAAAGALPLDRPEDRLNARVRLAEIGRMADPPPEVRKLLQRHGLQPGDSQAFADALLPPKHEVGAFKQNSYHGPYQVG